MSSSKEAKKSRRRSDAGSATKKPKIEEAPFSDPKSLVTFLVGPGPDPTEFIAHKEFVCRHSKVLEAAFNSGFIEGQSQTYRLEDTSPAAFRLLMEWFYLEKLTLLQTSPGYVLDVTDMQQEFNEDMSLAELWVLAEKFAMPVLQNKIIDSMQQIVLIGDSIPSRTFQYIYANTAAGSALRKYAVKTCVRYRNEGQYSENADLHPPQMMVDIAEDYVVEFNTPEEHDEDIKPTEFHVPVGKD
ncbi:hypothetical protein ONS95_008189 [Cadophora gregata]|uniref:uncharacterized protein n=1 Tax=Cadophora gregata TaxID=51156 RepID=UPI0026DB1FC9|nr:uncharacterized protein ONS95_008189 [Cadophora gregata]KAK0100224.1 hypothetical protein ONS96_007509 [Cadophora gregata f. sp. sojae]KAK0119347.1 hypothetical protein ONS96_012400 [Cadophora gregata f. sp. sojae]KAK0126601.1 hypothetical protein ONS95_008189 [Cadophora gregata]